MMATSLRSKLALILAMTLLVVSLAPGCGAFGMASPIVAGTSGGPWCEKRVAPPRPAPIATCPKECTRGCDHGACIIDGGGGATCPPGMPCVIRCDKTSACQGAKLACPPDANCEVRCEAVSACQMASIECPKEHDCTLRCESTSTCQLASMKCGHGKCDSSCGGTSASVGTIDCGGSCDCSTSCGDGGASYIRGTMAGSGHGTGAMPAVSADTWTPKVAGQIEVRSPGSTASASFTATATVCASGEPSGFKGVIIGSDGHPAFVVRFSDDERGLRAIVRGPGLLSAELSRATCRTIEGSLRRSGAAVNRVTLLEGSLTLDCTTADGVVIAGSVSFAACHRTSSDVARINADNAALDDDTRTTVKAFHVVSAPVGDEPRVSTELRDLRVVVRAIIVGTVPGGPDILDQAQRTVDGKARDYARRLGFTPVEDTAPHDLTMEVAMTGHVTFVDIDDMTAVVLPRSEQPSLRLLAGSSEILRVPQGPGAFRCEVTGTGDERKTKCVEWAARANDERTIAAINGSAELARIRRMRR